MPKQRKRQKVLKKRKFLKRAVEEPSKLYIKPVDSDAYYESSSDESSTIQNIKNVLPISSSSSSSLKSPFSPKHAASPLPGPSIRPRYSMKFRRLFASSSSSEHERKKLLSTSRSSISTLPDLEISCQRKRKFSEMDSDINFKKIQYDTSKIMSKKVWKDWTETFTKFNKKYFVLSFCDDESHGNTDVKEYCVACTNKAEREMKQMMQEKPSEQVREYFISD